MVGSGNYGNIPFKGGTMEEARDTKRLRKRLTMKFGIEQPSRVAFTEDISLQGLCIRTAMVYPPGSRLRMDLNLPDGGTASIAGVVMWAKKVPPNMVRLVKKCGMGVRITCVISGREEYAKLCEELQSR
jgi:PilZ domain